MPTIRRILVANRAVSSNFGTAEVLVSAKDLVNGTSIRIEDGLKDVTYIHLLLAQHHVLWANGVECESFEPNGAGTDTLATEDRLRLQSLVPDARRYGSLARRALTPTEAKVLCSQAA